MGSVVGCSISLLFVAPLFRPSFRPVCGPARTPPLPATRNPFGRSDPTIAVVGKPFQGMGSMLPPDDANRCTATSCPPRHKVAIGPPGVGSGATNSQRFTFGRVYVAAGLATGRRAVGLLAAVGTPRKFPTCQWPRGGRRHTTSRARRWACRSLHRGAGTIQRRRSCHVAPNKPQRRGRQKPRRWGEEGRGGNHFPRPMEFQSSIHFMFAGSASRNRAALRAWAIFA